MTLQSDHSMLSHLWTALGPREIDSKDEKDDLQRTCIGFVIVSSLVLKFAMIEIRSSTLARNHKARLWGQTRSGRDIKLKNVVFEDPNSHIPLVAFQRHHGQIVSPTKSLPPPQQLTNVCSLTPLEHGKETLHVEEQISCRIFFCENGFIQLLLVSLQTKTWCT